MTGEEQFITAIIEQAIEDCAYTGTSVKMLKFKRDAIDWIISNDPEFLNYCKMLGMDSDTIRNKIIKHVDMSYSQKQKLKIKSADAGRKIEEKFFA